MRIWGIFFGVLAGLIGGNLYAFSGASVAVSSATKSASSNYTITFSTESDETLSQNDVVVIQFLKTDGLGLVSSVMNASGGSSDSGTTSSSLTCTSSTYDEIRCTVGAGGVAISIALTVKFDAITNPSAAGAYKAKIYKSTTATDFIRSSNFFIGDVPVYGKVTDASGNAVANSGVYLSKSDYSMSNNATTNSLGEFFFPSYDHITAGTYKLEISSPYGTTGNGLSIPDPTSLTISDPKVTLTQNLSFVAATKTATITLKNSKGNPITDANVSLYKMNGSGSAQKEGGNASGEYIFTIGGGSWSVSVWPQNYSTAKWVPTYSYITITFAQDTSTETKSVSMTFPATSATIKGTATTENGCDSAPNVSIWSTSGNGGYGGVGGHISNSTRADSGTCAFSLTVPAGTYNLNITPYYTSSTSTLSPYTTTVTVKEDETKDVGTITLKSKTDTLVCKTVKSDGTALKDLYCSAWQVGGSDYANANTGTDGKATLYVSPGVWEVSVYNSNSNYYQGSDQSGLGDLAPNSNEGMQRVTITSGGSQAVTFTFASVNATLTGKLVDAAGDVIKSDGWISANESSVKDTLTRGASTYFGGRITNGIYNFKVAAGTYELCPWFAQDTGYSTSGCSTVTVASGGTVTTTINVLKNDAVISGKFVDDSGNTVTTLPEYSTHVNCESKNHNFVSATVNVSAGTYSCSVSSGDWWVGYYLMNSSGYANYNESKKVSVDAGTTKTLDLKLRKVNATISGTIKNSSGNALQNIYVEISTRSSEGGANSSSTYQGFQGGATTDSDGKYSVKVPAGTYYCRTHIPAFGNFSIQNDGLFPAKQQEVKVGENQTESCDLSMKKSAATISVTVTADSGCSSIIGSTMVTGFSKDGSYNHGFTNTSGGASLSVTAGTWSLRAVNEYGTYFCSSNEATLEVTEGNNESLTLKMSKGHQALPEAVTASFDCGTARTMELGDGTTISASAGAFGSTGTTCSVVIDPKAAMIYHSTFKPANVYGYAFDVTDSNGATIESFNSPITFTIPYDDDTLADLGLLVEEAYPAYYNISQGNWEPVSDFVLNSTTKTISFSVRHATDFTLGGNGNSNNISSAGKDSAGTSSAAGGGGGFCSLTSRGDMSAGIGGVLMFLFLLGARSVQKKRAMIFLRKSRFFDS